MVAAVCIAVGALTIAPTTAARWGFFLAVSLLVGGIAVRWYQQTTQLFCPGCGKHIDKGMIWVCGFCNEANDGRSDNDIVDKCASCRKAPGLLICPHPHEDSAGGVALYAIHIAEGDDAHPARLVTKGSAGETLADTKARWARELQEIETRIENQGSISTRNLAAAVTASYFAKKELENSRSLYLPQAPRPVNDAATKKKTAHDRVLEIVKEKLDSHAAFEEGIQMLMAHPRFTVLSEDEKEDEIQDLKRRFEKAFDTRR